MAVKQKKRRHPIRADIFALNKVHLQFSSHSRDVDEATAQWSNHCEVVGSILIGANYFLLELASKIYHLKT